MPLKIGAGDLGQIHDHAREAYPEECAGALVGVDSGGIKVVVDVWRAENTHEEERSRRFLIEPLEVKKFEEQAEEQDMGLLGFYHSHPHSDPWPSETDLAESNDDRAVMERRFRIENTYKEVVAELCV